MGAKYSIKLQYTRNDYLKLILAVYDNFSGSDIVCFAVSRLLEKKTEHCQFSCFYIRSGPVTNTTVSVHMLNVGLSKWKSFIVGCTRKQCTAATLVFLTGFLRFKIWIRELFHFKFKNFKVVTVLSTLEKLENGMDFLPLLSWKRGNIFL